MNLQFPARTQELISINPRILPDAVLARLRVEALLGRIREIRGIWYRIRPPTDEDDTTPQKVYKDRASGISRSYGECPICGKPLARARAKMCSQKCKSRADSVRMTLPRPNCKACGKPVNGACNRYCSRACVTKARVGSKYAK